MCAQVEPKMRQIGLGHYVACHFPLDAAEKPPAANLSYRPMLKMASPSVANFPPGTVHLPASSGAQGNTNVTNGCINLSTGDAEQYFRDHPDVVSNLLNGLSSAIDLTKSDPAEAEKLDIPVSIHLGVASKQGAKPQTSTGIIEGQGLLSSGAKTIPW